MVVGAVIDPEMQNELRVTIVATGIGMAAKSEAEPAPSAVKLVQKTAGKGEGEYSRHERPERRQKAVGDNYGERTDGGDLDYLDIPAFLRRQAD